MSKKYLIILFLLIIITLNTVNAIDNETIQLTDDNDQTEEVNNDSLENTGSFIELQELIDNTASGTIDLEKDYEYNSSTDSSLIEGITITQSGITINGNNHTLNAKNQIRIFNIQASNIVLKNINFINGNESHYRYGNYGGAIYWQGSNGVLINSTFINNTVKDTAGAIYWSGLSGKIINSTFKDNTITGNGQGAAVYWNRDSSSMKITNSTFINNKILGSAGSGGALYWHTASNIEISNSIFINNSATNGGAIRWDYDEGTGSVTIANSTFINNKGYYGGAIRSDRSGNARIINSKFINNTATSSLGGGAVLWYNAKNGQIINSTFENNTAKYDGGAVRWYNSNNGLISYSTFINNKATNGGAISWDGGNNGRITNSDFINNIASNNGDEIRWNGGNMLNILASYFNNSNSEYVIHASNNLFLSNNVLDKHNYIYLENNTIISKTNIIVLHNQTTDANLNTIFKAVIFDDNYNKVILSDNHPKMEFIISDNDTVEAAQDINGEWSANYTFNENGIYHISAKQENLTNSDIFIAILTVKYDSNLSVFTNQIDYGENATITLTIDKNARGNITLNVNNTEYMIVLNDTQNGTVNINISGLNAGNYNITATYISNNLYFDTNASAILTINKINPTITIETEDILVDEIESITAKLNEDSATGNLTVIVNNESYTVKSNQTLKISDLFAGIYEVTVNYSGDVNYKNITNATSFKVNKKNSTITVNAQDIIAGNNLILTIKISDNATGNIDINVNGEKIDSVNANQTIYDITGLKANKNYEITVNYTGDNSYNPSSNKTIIKVSPIENYIFEVNVNDTILNQTTNATIILPADATGIIKINNIEYEIQNIIELPIQKIIGLNNITLFYIPDENSNYAQSNTTAQYNVSKLNTIINVSDVNVFVDEDITIKVISNTGSKLIVTIDNIEYTVVNGSVVIPKGILPAGEYIIAVNASENQNYTSNNANATLTVLKLDSIVNVSDVNVYADEDIVINIGSNRNSGLVLIVSGVEYTVINGSVVIPKGVLPAREYIIAVNALENNKYLANSSNSTLKINKKASKIDSIIVNPSYLIGDEINIEVKFANVDFGNTIININENKYNISIINYTASLNLTLSVGNYDVNVTFLENNLFNPTSEKSNFEVIGILITANDAKRGLNSEINYEISVNDTKGNPISNKQVIFSLNNQKYNTTTDDKGIAGLNISSLNIGNYTVKITSDNADDVSANIEIVKRIIENNDLTMDFRDGSKFSVKAIDDYGNPVKSGEIVIIKVNGKTYNVKTDENGYANLLIRLKPKTYTITAQYMDYKTANKIIVNNVVKVNNIKLKKSSKKLTLKATLKYSNGKVIKSKKITFKFRGKTYTAKTNSKGVTSVKITKNIINKLKIGKKYNYSVKYYDKTIKKIVNVVK